MNFKVNLLFHLYETPFILLGIPNPIVQRLGEGGGHYGEYKFVLKCFSGKKKSILRRFFFILMGNRVIEDPPSQFDGKFH